MEILEKSPLDIIKEQFELTGNEGTKIKSIKGVNPHDILELLRKHGHIQLEAYRSKSLQDE